MELHDVRRSGNQLRSSVPAATVCNWWQEGNFRVELTSRCKCPVFHARTLPTLPYVHLPRGSPQAGSRAVNHAHGSSQSSDMVMTTTKARQELRPDNNMIQSTMIITSHTLVTLTLQRSLSLS